MSGLFTVTDDIDEFSSPAGSGLALASLLYFQYLTGLTKANSRSFLTLASSLLSYIFENFENNEDLLWMFSNESLS